MSKKTIALIALSIVLISSIPILPTFAAVYSPGVSKGQYIKYSDFAGVGQGVENFNDYDWLKLEVTAISGKGITLLSTGQYKDGSPILGNGTAEVWNIETGTLNGIPSTQGPIIAANLNKGDQIPPSNTYAANRTETRSYLGTIREVIVLESTISTPDYNSTLNYVYDRASGLLLESHSATVQGQPATTSTFSYIVADTNVFGTSNPSPRAPELPFWIIIAFLIIGILIIGLVAYRKKI